MTTLQKRSRFITGIMAVMVILLVSSVGVASVPAMAEQTTTSYKIAHVTDMHVFIEEYANIYSQAYVNEQKGSKLLEETQLASEVAFNEIMSMDEPPMYIFITGDLTSDGELANHEWVSAFLKDVTAKMRAKPGYEGFQIFVIPGNHDLYNKNAQTFMPTAEEIEACTSYEELENLLRDFGGASVVSATASDFFRLYSDFGYCDCAGRKNGVHDDGCGMADGCTLEFFYESDYWYGGHGISRADVEPVDGTEIPEDVQSAYEDSKNFALIQAYAKLCSLSYIARIENMTVLGLNADSRDYDTGFVKDLEKGKATVAEIANRGWHETTGAYLSDECLTWAVESLKEDVKQNRAIFTLGHANFVPHFTMEDEIISLFVYDNWEEATYTLADAGIRYGFTGHQHANDQVDYVSQNGNVFYDFETGSLISLGSAYRMIEYTQTVSGNRVVENIQTELCFLTDSSTPNTYTYSRPELYNEEGTFGVKMTEAVVKDTNGTPISVGDYLVLVNEDMLGSVESGMLGAIINDSLYDTLKGLTASMGSMPYTAALLDGLIGGLCDLDFYKFIPNEDGWFSLSTKPEKDYDLVTFAIDALNWVLSYDFSYGEVDGGYTLSDGYMDVYGAHLNGTGTTEIPQQLKPLLTALDNGDFVKWLIDFLCDALVPQLQLVFDAPIRILATSAELGEGEGFDLVSARQVAASGAIDGIVKSLLDKTLFKTVDTKGYYSLNGILADLTAFLKSDDLEGTINTLLGALGGGSADGITGLIPTVLEYLQMYLDGGCDLGKTLDDALIDKYVTDSFCRNIGGYGKSILESFVVDTTYDHAYVDASATNLFKARGEKYTVTSEGLFNGNTYDSDFAVEVTPTTENGLKPSRISLSFGNNVYTDRNFKWFTAIQVDITNRADTPDSYIRYGTSSDLSDATSIKAQAENVLEEIPTIDLGILYLNMNYAVKTYNRYTVSLTGLEEGKTYYYQVGSDKYGWSDVYSFTTGNSSTDSFEFMAFSDIQGSVERNYTESRDNLYNATKSTDTAPSFILSAGDNVDNGKSFLQYVWLLDRQVSTWANNTHVTVAGNHEDNHFDITDNMATPSGATVQETGLYYSYDYLNTHFVLLDTNDLSADNNLSETQYNWLEDDLDKANGNEDVTFIIVVMHKGPYTAGSHAFDSDVIALRQQLTPLFYNYEVDLVLQGHDHTYSVSEYLDDSGETAEVSYNYDGSVVTDGVLYVNLGTMGDKFYNYLYSEEVLIATRESAPTGLEKYLTDEGYLELTETPVYTNISVDADKITLNSYAYTANGVVKVDTIEIARGVLTEPQTKSLPVGAIIGIAAAAIAVAGGIVAVVLVIAKKKSTPQAINQ